MEPETRYTVIGAVVLALIGAAVFGYLWLSSSGRAADFHYYTVYFERQSLSGLQVGGNVNMRGINVGRVEYVQPVDATTSTASRSTCGCSATRRCARTPRLRCRATCSPALPTSTWKRRNASAPN